MSALHVLMVLDSSYPAGKGGGAEGQVRTLARALRQHGHRVTILAPRLARGPQRKIDRVDRVPVYRIPYPRIPLIGQLWLWAVTVSFLVRRRHRYDAWHAHIAHRLAGVCAVLSRWLHKPFMVKVAGSWELERGTLSRHRGLLDYVSWLGLRHARAWQAISRRMAATLASRGVDPGRIVAVPNAVSVERFEALRPATAAPARFIFIGRLMEVKGLDLLLDAFSDIAARHPAARLVLVGTGVLENALKAQAESLGIADRVEFTGHRDDIETLLSACNIGVQCSRLEGLSNTLLESMASGLPMVASRISGNEDFVRDGENGWLFEPGDREGLARCLAQAAETSPEQRTAMGENARATVRRQAGVEAVLTRLLALYRGASPALMSAQVVERSG